MKFLHAACVLKQEADSGWAKDLKKHPADHVKSEEHIASSAESTPASFGEILAGGASDENDADALASRRSIPLAAATSSASLTLGNSSARRISHFSLGSQDFVTRDRKVSLYSAAITKVGGVAKQLHWHSRLTTIRSAINLSVANTLTLLSVEVCLPQSLRWLRGLQQLLSFLGVGRETQ